MAITQGMCTSFKVALLDGEMDFSSDTSDVFYIALYTSSATLSAATTAYSVTNEISGTGYIAGGAIITVVTNPTSSGTTAYLDFTDTTWGSSTLTARGALIYKSGGGDPSVAVLDFGEDKVSSGGNFTVQWPTGDVSNAIIRIL